GNDYEQAMEYSGNPVIASAFAFVDSAFSAYVEIGSGVENLANDGAKILTNKQKAVKVWESWYEEGGEELIQNNANKLLSWIMYGDGIDSNEELVSYLKELGYESLMGAFAGGLMGAGEMTFQSIVNFRSDTELKSLGNEILNSNNSADIISELKIYFSKSLDAELREIANDIDVNNPDAKLVGALYQSLCRDINTAINSQKTTEGATNGLKMVFNQAGTESKIIYSMATPQYLDTVSQLGVDKATAVDNVFNTIAVVGDNSNIDNSKIKSNRDITEADTEVVQHNDQGGASAEISSVPNNPDRAAPGVVESSDGRQYFDDGSGDEYFGDTDDVGENMSHLTTTEGGASPQGEAFDSSSFDLAEPTQKDIARAPSAQEAIDEAITGKQKTNIQRHILDICKKLFPNITVEFVNGLKTNGKFIRSQNKVLIRSDLSAVQMYVEVFKHEFMHRLETKQLYSKFFNFCFNKSKAFEQYVRTELKTAGVDVDAATREGVLQAYTNYKYEQYKNSRDIPKVDRDAFTKENAQEEIIADFFAQILFQGKKYRARIIEALQNADGEMLIGIGDEASSKAALMELQQKEPTLFEQVIEWFKDVINKLRGLPQAKSLVEQLDNEINLLESMARRVYWAKDSKLISEIEFVQEKYSVKNTQLNSNKYWYPNMTKAEIELVKRIAKREINTPDNYIDNENKWLYNKFGDKTYFALYSTEDINEPTVLYACKGDRAEFEYWYFINKWFEKEVQGNGTIYTKSGVIERLSKSGGNSSSGRIAHISNVVGRGSDTGDARLYIRNTRRRPSEALRDCLRNIREIQERDGRGLGRRLNN
ncbi:MAG: hypothetical protein IJZ21_04050, partial [Clostridia bacterium]|nr:hypothetical protein [Clostridia bacterium]